MKILKLIILLSLCSNVSESNECCHIFQELDHIAERSKCYEVKLALLRLLSVLLSRTKAGTKTMSEVCLSVS